MGREGQREVGDSRRHLAVVVKHLLAPGVGRVTIALDMSFFSINLTSNNLNTAVQRFW